MSFAVLFAWLGALLFCHAWLCALLFWYAWLCLTLLLERLVTFGCVPCIFAEMLLLHASIASDVMFGCVLHLLFDMFGCVSYT